MSRKRTLQAAEETDVHLPLTEKEIGNLIAMGFTRDKIIQAVNYVDSSATTDWVNDTLSILITYPVSESKSSPQENTDKPLSAAIPTPNNASSSAKPNDKSRSNHTNEVRKAQLPMDFAVLFEFSDKCCDYLLDQLFDDNHHPMWRIDDTMLLIVCDTEEYTRVSTVLQEISFTKKDNLWTRDNPEFKNREVVNNDTSAAKSVDEMKSEIANDGISIENDSEYKEAVNESDDVRLRLSFVSSDSDSDSDTESKPSPKRRRSLHSSATNGRNESGEPPRKRRRRSNNSDSTIASDSSSSPPADAVNSSTSSSSTAVAINHSSSSAPSLSSASSAASPAVNQASASSSSSSGNPSWWKEEVTSDSSGSDTSPSSPLANDPTSKTNKMLEMEMDVNDRLQVMETALLEAGAKFEQNRMKYKNRIANNDSAINALKRTRYQMNRILVDKPVLDINDVNISRETMANALKWFDNATQKIAKLHTDYANDLSVQNWHHSEALSAKQAKLRALRQSYQDEKFAKELMEKDNKSGGRMILEDWINILIFNTPRLAKYRNVDTMECDICFLDKIPKSQMMIFKCYHAYCQQCLQSTLKVKIENRNVRDIQCPFDGCDHILTHEEIRLFLDRDMFEKYEMSLLDNTLETDKDCKFCPAPDCGCPMFADPDSPDPRLTCPKCKKRFCFRCKTADPHDGVSCESFQQWKKDNDAADAKFDEWSSTNTKACPQCNSLIQKNGGCDHMSCSICRNNFNWSAASYPVRAAAGGGGGGAAGGGGDQEMAHAAAVPGWPGPWQDDLSFLDDMPFANLFASGAGGGRAFFFG